MTTPQAITATRILRPIAAVLLLLNIAAGIRQAGHLSAVFSFAVAAVLIAVIGHQTFVIRRYKRQQGGPS